MQFRAFWEWRISGLLPGQSGVEAYLGFRPRLARQAQASRLPLQKVIVGSLAHVVPRGWRGGSIRDEQEGLAMAVRAVAGRNWNSTFDRWSGGPSASEQEKCANAERAVRAAISASNALGQHEISVFTQGSYRNRTNVRLESDVDVCVCLKDTYSTHYDSGLSDADVGNVPATYQHADFKNDVEKALKAHFGTEAVTRGKKAFDVHENSYRIDADVVPALEYRWYFKDEGRVVWHTGTAIFPDGGIRIVNWPDQHYTNGVRKNDQTNRHFKRVVRILKRLRNEMDEAGIQAAGPIASYLIECLVWNVPNVGLGRDYYDEVRYAVAHLFNNTLEEEKVKEWGEVNELKYLFRPSQPWTREKAHAFLSAAWDYVGFE